MNLRILSRTISFFVLTAVLAAPVFADVVETKNGARIVGKVTKIDGGNIYVSTDFAGDLTIKQAEVTAITTDTPVVVRLATGTTLQGVVSSEAGAVKITGADGQLTT